MDKDAITTSLFVHGDYEYRISSNERPYLSKRRVEETSDFKFLVQITMQQKIGLFLLSYQTSKF